MTRVTVVGAGVVGLSCAVRLAEAGFQVDVLARELPLETTSSVAGGLWLPFLAEPLESVVRWGRAGLEEFARLADAGAPGVFLRDGQLVGGEHEHDRPPPWSAGMESMLRLARTSHPTGRHRAGWQLRVPLVDMTVYLPYLTGRLAAAGGTLTRLALAALPTRGLVVNCTGVAARALAADPSVHPVRGQVLRLTNPGLDTWWEDSSDPAGPTYVLPHAKHVVVGGSAEVGDWSTTPDPELGEQILKRATLLVPQLASAKVLATRVGLRPARPTVRLESVAAAEGTTIHCYGHGGSGVTLSWGSADDVVELARKV